MRLNGWQRLWVVSMIMVGVVVISVGVSGLPTESRLLSGWSYGGLRLIQVHVQDRAMERHVSMDEIRPANNTDRQIVDMLRRYPQEHAQDADKNQQELLDGISKLNGKFERDLEELLSRQVSYLGELLAGWLGTGAAVYVLGWGVAWIRRGFKAGGATE